MNEEQKKFLESLITLNNSERKRRVLECSDEELNLLVSCIQNLKNLVLTHKEETVLTRFKKVYALFKKIKNKKDLKFVRKWIVAHQKFLKAVIGFTLFKLTEFAISCLLSKT